MPRLTGVEKLFQDHGASVGLWLSTEPAFQVDLCHGLTVHFELDYSKGIESHHPVSFAFRISDMLGSLYAYKKYAHCCMFFWF